MNDQLNILKMLPDSGGKLFEMWDMCIRNYPDFSGHVFSSCVYVVPLQACLYNTTNETGQVRFAVNIFSDFTERMELEQRKDDFIGMASHELKTPITSLKGFAQLLNQLKS
jgi:His Kinase A (phospho-acceptor) domain